MRTLGIAIACLVLVASDARAESAFDGGGTWFGGDTGPLCHYGTPPVTPPAGSIPANTPSFSIAIVGPISPWETRMTRIRDQIGVPLAFGPSTDVVQFAPMVPLVPGESYLVEHPPCPGGPTGTTVYDVADPITLPSLGTVAVRGPFASNDRAGVCHRRTFVIVDLTPDPAMSDAPWSSFTWGARVDGAASDPDVPLTLTHVRIDLDCGGESLGPPIAEGSHAFGAIGSPWTTAAPITIATADVTFVARCADAMRVDAHLLTPLTPEQLTFWDTDTDGSCTADAGADADAALAPMDGGVTTDGAPHTEPDTHPNCAIGARATRTPWLTALAIVSVLLGRARARAARRAGRPTSAPSAR